MCSAIMAFVAALFAAGFVLGFSTTVAVPADAPQVATVEAVTVSGEGTPVVITADLSQTITVGSGATIQIPADWTGAANPTGAILNSSDFNVFSLVFDSAGLASTSFVNSGGALTVMSDYYSKLGAGEAFDPAAVELYTTPDGRTMAATAYTQAEIDGYLVVVDFANGSSGIVDGRGGMGPITDENKALLLQIAATFSE